LTLLDVTDDLAPVVLDAPQNHINSILPLAVAKLAFCSDEYREDMSDQSSMAIAIIQAINATLDLHFNITVSNEFSNITRSNLFNKILKEIEGTVNRRMKDLELRRLVYQGSISISQDGQLSMMHDGRPGYFGSGEKAVLGILVLCEAYKIVSDYFSKQESGESVSLRKMPLILDDFFQRMDISHSIGVLNYLSIYNRSLILISNPNSYEQTVVPSKFLSNVGCVYGLVMHLRESGVPNIGFDFNATYFELYFGGSTFEGTEIKRGY